MFEEEEKKMYLNSNKIKIISALGVVSEVIG
jgi:hypothetical protein